MSDVKWIKITTDIFNNEKLILIDTLPERDAINVIWFKLLVLAGSKNDSGNIKVMDQMPYTDEMLATVFRRPVNTVRFALKILQQFKMIEVLEDKVISVINWEKYQNIEGLDKIREDARKRQQKCRAKQKSKMLEQKNKLLEEKKDSHVTVTLRNDTELELELERELELELDKEIDKDKDKKHGPAEAVPNMIYKNVIDYLNWHLGTRYKHTTKSTKSLIKARMNEGFTEDDFKLVIDNMCAKWTGTDMEQYLRPQTLFGPKFDSYLNVKIQKKRLLTQEGHEIDKEELENIPF